MRGIVGLTLVAAVVASCGGASAPASPSAAVPTMTAPAPATTAGSPAATAAATAGGRPLFLTAALADVRSGERLTIGGFGGKVTLVLAMAVW